MQAIILAAGMGRRLGEFTAQNTKCMLEVNERRLIDRMLDQLSSYNLNRIVIVTGYYGRNLRSHISSNHPDLPIEYIDNPIYDKTNNIYSLWLARKEMAEDDTLLLESDVIFRESVLRSLVETPFENCALVSHYETWMDGTMVEISENGDILNFVPKAAFKFSETENYYKTVNFYKFSREFITDHYLPFLDSYMKVLGENEYYEQVLRVITLIDKTSIKALPVPMTDWYEIDDVQDLRIAEILFASPAQKLKKIYESGGGYWRYPGMIDFSHPSNPFFPTKKLLDELKSNFEPLLSGIPSGNKVISMLSGKFFGLSRDLATAGNNIEELTKALSRVLEGKFGAFANPVLSVGKDLQEINDFKVISVDYELDSENIASVCLENNITNLVVTNPDNRFGSLIHKKELLEIIDFCERTDKRIILDETCIEFADEDENVSLLSSEFLLDHPSLIVLKSISREYGVQGLNLAVIASGDKELISKLKREIGERSINSVSEFFLQIYNKYEKEFAVSCQKLREERTLFYTELSSIPGLRVYPSQSDFLVCEIMDRKRGEKLSEHLLSEYDILVKDFSSEVRSSEGKTYLRISILTREKNIRLSEALMNCLS